MVGLREVKTRYLECIFCGKCVDLHSDEWGWGVERCTHCGKNLEYWLAEVEIAGKLYFEMYDEEEEY